MCMLVFLRSRNSIAWAVPLKLNQAPSGKVILFARRKTKIGQLCRTVERHRRTVSSTISPGGVDPDINSWLGQGDVMICDSHHVHLGTQRGFASHPGPPFGLPKQRQDVSLPPFGSSFDAPKLLQYFGRRLVATTHCLWTILYVFLTKVDWVDWPFFGWRGCYLDT